MTCREILAGLQAESYPSSKEGYGSVRASELFFRQSRAASVIKPDSVNQRFPFYYFTEKQT